MQRFASGGCRFSLLTEKFYSMKTNIKTSATNNTKARGKELRAKQTFENQTYGKRLFPGRMIALVSLLCTALGAGVGPVAVETDSVKAVETDSVKAVEADSVKAVEAVSYEHIPDRLTEEDFREVAEDYPEITADDCIIDALCMKLVQKPEQFDVLVAPNLYGDIISDLCAGLVGGLGFAPSANIGDKTRIYEAVHGSAPDIAGQNKANPSAILMAFAMMLNDLGMTDKAQKLNAAILAQVAEGKIVTADIGGTAGTKEFTQAVIARL